MNHQHRHHRWAVIALATVTMSAWLLASAPVASAAGSNALTVTAGEYTYQMKGSLKAGWVQINFVNKGVESHMMAIGHIKPGVTAAQVKKAAASNDQNAFAPLAVGDGNVAPTPGLLGPDTSTGLITKLAAGHYVMMCFFTAPDGESHIAHGMVKTFDVAKGKSSLTPPKDGVAAVDLTDTAVTLPPSGFPAKGYAKVTNSSTTNRDLNFAKLQTGVTLQQADSYFNTLFGGGEQPTGTPPAVLSGGLQGLPKGATAYLVLDFSKGSYGYSSQNPDLPDNDPNPVEGTFEIK